MTRELLVNLGAGETRVALVEQGRLEGFWTEPAIGAPCGRVGETWLARVAKVVPAMQAAFVDLGLERDGFLSLRDAPALHEGQAIVVEITREADGAKGPKLKARTSLPPGMEAQRGAATPPQRLHAGPGAIERALKSLPKGTPVFIDDARAAQALRQAFAHLPVTPAQEDLFARHDLEEQVAQLFHARVALPGGGWITIQPTEGMTAVDVNSGGFSASGGREETARAVNLEAAREIGRQLRLRDTGGLIVVDFIQMAESRAVIAALEQALNRYGPDDSRISPMADFGIVAIARRRRTAALAVRRTCRCCGGRGHVAAVQTQALAILRQVERSARAAPGHEIVVRAGAGVGEWLAAHQTQVRAGLDRRGVGRVRYVSEEREDFDVSTQ
jgi:ribonuclease G